MSINQTSSHAARSLEEKEKTQELAQACYAAAATHVPAMVAIKPGHFQMDSPENEAGYVIYEGRQHQVTIPRPFAISRFEITVGQFRQFVQEAKYQSAAENTGKGCFFWNTETKQLERQPEGNWKNPGFAQNDHHPVVCVSWDDAQAYVKWLLQRTGTLYRLPSEAEWEYVALAGTKTVHHQYLDIRCAYPVWLEHEPASIADPKWALAGCTDSHVYTVPVASFAENQFGLFDMLGNVWEWTEDCSHENYQGAPADGSAWKEANDGDCNRRVVRGELWIDTPQFLRLALRNRSSADDAVNILGFRIVRDF